MNKHDAKIIAETITNKQLSEMFEAAKANIKDWTVTSKVNKGLSKGVAWNILASDFDIEGQYHILAKRNMVREFGDFLPDDLKPKKENKIEQNVVHQEPTFKK